VGTTNYRPHPQFRTCSFPELPLGLEKDLSRSPKICQHGSVMVCFRLFAKMETVWGEKHTRVFGNLLQGKDTLAFETFSSGPSLLPGPGMPGIDFRKFNSETYYAISLAQTPSGNVSRLFPRKISSKTSTNLCLFQHLKSFVDGITVTNAALRRVCFPGSN
jgi:hypothetical protein